MPVEFGITIGGTQPRARVERVEMKDRRSVFTIAAEREPSDVTFDPNTWLLIDQVSFVKRP
jgi:hypothetical protein